MKYRRWMFWSSAALVAGGLLTAVVEKTLARESQRNTDPLELKIESSAPDRSTGLVSSYAPMIQKTAPAVVNVFTSKTIRRPDSYGMMPFFNDPNFQRFFGDRFRRMPQTPRSFEQRSLGSGVIVTANGYILTNDHVVNGADEIKITFENSGKEYEAEIIGRDPETDIAVLKVDADNLPHATFADSDLVLVGDVVLAIGNPFGIGQTVTQGIVSAVGRGGMGIENYEDFIQTDAAINPGNSGGALIDAQGRLVGINTAILSQTGGNHGVGFAIPSNLVRSVLNQIVDTGEVRRGFLGVNIQNLTPDLAEEFGLKNNLGALVAEVTSNSAAEEAGIKRGDVITAINNKPVRDNNALRNLIGQATPGSNIEVSLVRGGKEKTLTATLKALPGSKDVSSSKSSGSPDDEGALRGVGVADLSPQTRSEFNVPEEVEGAVINGINPDSDAYKAGLREGDVILEINRERVRNAEEAVEACNESRDGTTLVNFWRDGAHRYVVVREKIDR
ncbi:MAG: DegQ family serine endoprotease [Limisphaerales bacterium]|jgi:serine protease Do